MWKELIILTQTTKLLIILTQTSSTSTKISSFVNLKETN